MKTTTNFYKWKSLCRKAGATCFDGDKDICEALTSNPIKGNLSWIGSWDGEKGEIVK